MSPQGRLTRCNAKRAEEQNSYGVTVGGTVDDTAPSAWKQSSVTAFIVGALVGIFGGLIGLGGAEFRLPILLAVFGFSAVSAVILNKAMSLVVVVAAIPARWSAVSLSAVSAEWPVVVNLLTGSLLGAWVGASWAVRMASTALHRVLAVLLVLIAAVFAAEHYGSAEALELSHPVQIAAGVGAGFVIGVVAALLGVAGGELLIPTLVILFAVNVKLAGSLSLLVSLPTMLVAFFRYSRDQAFAVLGANRALVAAMATGSVAGSLVGGLLVGLVSEAALAPLLIVLLALSAVKVWQHRSNSSQRVTWDRSSGTG